MFSLFLAWRRPLGYNYIMVIFCLDSGHYIIHWWRFSSSINHRIFMWLNLISHWTRKRYGALHYNERPTLGFYRDAPAGSGISLICALLYIQGVGHWCNPRYPGHYITVGFAGSCYSFTLIFSLNYDGQQLQVLPFLRVLFLTALADKLCYIRICRNKQIPFNKVVISHLNDFTVHSSIQK